MRGGALFALAAASLVAPPAVAEGALSEAPAGQVETLTAAELAGLLEAGGAVLIDVRSPAEFAGPRLPGALNAPVEQFDPAMVPQDRARETILYCRSDRRSAIAASALAVHWGQRVRHLQGGITAWQEAGLPVIEGEGQAPS